MKLAWKALKYAKKHHSNLFYELARAERFDFSEITDVITDRIDAINDKAESVYKDPDVIFRTPLANIFGAETHLVDRMPFARIFCEWKSSDTDCGPLGCLVGFNQHNQSFIFDIFCTAHNNLKYIPGELIRDTVLTPEHADLDSRYEHIANRARQENIVADVSIYTARILDESLKILADTHYQFEESYDTRTINKLFKTPPDNAPPFSRWSVVYIRPPRKGRHAGMIGVKKAYHAVRGHQRHLQDGRVIQVKPHHRGDKSIGTVLHKNYEIRRTQDEA